MYKVKDFSNWTKIIFPDRTILRCDLKYMSWEQIKSLDNVVVRSYEEEDEELILFAE